MKAVLLDSNPTSALVCKADVEADKKSNTDLKGFVVQSGLNLGNWVGSNPVAGVTLFGRHCEG